MIKIQKNDLYYETRDSAGFDIKAAETGKVMPGQCRAIPTGLVLDTKQSLFWRLVSRWVVPELQIRPRSGLAFKYSIMVCNSPGTIDCQYPKEIKVLLYNPTQAIFDYKEGDRIAQGVVSLAFRAKGVKIKDTTRTGGLGSTGGK